MNNTFDRSRKLSLIAACVLLAGAATAHLQAAAENTRKPDFTKINAAPTPVKKKAPTGEPSTPKADAAFSPVYAVNSKQCRNDDAGNVSEGDDFQKVCKGVGGYQLVLSGFDYRVKHEIRSDGFSVMLFPLDAGAASKYERADLYDEKLGNRIEWRLDARGKPFAIIVRAAFYKNTGSAKTFSNPKNRVAEFVFVRGLKGNEDLKVDLPTTGTAFNPDEQARAIAAAYLEKRRR